MAMVNIQSPEFQTQLRIGAGRAAFRRIDKIMRYEISILALKADEEWENLKCKSQKELPKFLFDLVYITDVLKAAAQVGRRSRIARMNAPQGGGSWACG